MVSTFESTGPANLLRVMVVDTRAERRELIRHLVAGTGLAEADIDEAASADEALELVDRGRPDVAVVEIQMPVSQGLETIAALRRRSSALRIVVCSFHRDPATKEQARREGADRYLDKPVGSDSLAAVLRQLAPDGGAVIDVRSEEQPQPTGA